MENKLNKKHLAFLSKKRNIIIIVSSLLLVLIIIALFFLMQPQRTVVNFCQVAKDEKSNFQANTNYSTLLDTFKKLDAVAPNTIRPDTSLIANGYQSIVSDPSKATMTELGMANSQLKVSNYITQNCPNY